MALPGTAGRSRGNSKLVGVRTPPRRGCAAQPEARCVGAPLLSAGQHSSPEWRLRRLQRQRRSAAGSPSVRMLAQPDSRACRLAPGGPLKARCWWPVRLGPTGLPGNHRPPATMSICACCAMTPPAALHFADAPLRTAFRSLQSVRVEPNPAGKRGGFCSPVASDSVR